MQVDFEIDLDQADQDALMTALGCNAAELDLTISKHAKAALREYLECYLGRRSFSRGGDVLEFRLSLLTQHAFDNQIPDDARVSRLFQTTPAASRTIIRNALSKFRYELKAASEATVKSLLECIRWEGDKCYVESKAQNVIELINQRLTELDATLPSVKRVPDSIATYAINELAYNKLCDAVAATRVAKPE
ncbi:hypothetical protein [Mesorhizobium sp. M0091]|uniref:hypothetical protein n=1 Tax=Mesorhizobium sp. M0091 TaxID=2956875 RepID=UPI00333C809F